MTGDNPPPKNRLRRILIALVSCGVIGLVTWVVWLARPGRPPQIATFPDGSTVELCASLAAGATFSTETKFEKFARRWLPNRFTASLPMALSGGISHGANCIEVYVRPTPWRDYEKLPWAGYFTEDDAGFCYPGDNGRGSIGDASTVEAVRALPLRYFPRRQREFLLHLTDTKGKTVATFTVTNPFPTTFPVWLPLTMPQTLTNGPLTLTLESLKKTTNKWGPYLIPRFRTQSTGPAWMNANPHNWTLHDASGNEGPVLSPRESAWKLRTLIYRERLQDFATNEILTLPNLPVPATGQFVSIDKSAVLDGVGIRVLVIGGAGTFGISNNQTRFMTPGSTGSGGHSSYSSSSTGTLDTWDSSMPFLLIEMRNSLSEDLVHVQVLDPEGRNVTDVYSASAQFYAMPDRNLCKFSPPPNAKFVSVRIWLDRPLAFDFLVNPADVQ